jgi:hypothetical protein
LKNDFSIFAEKNNYTTGKIPAHSTMLMACFEEICCNLKNA